MRLFSTFKSETRTSEPVPREAPSLSTGTYLFASPEIKGCIDSVEGDEVRGWIIDHSAPNRYITLCLFANDKFVEKASTCIFRKDLEQLFGTRGLHGFALRIPEALTARSEFTIEIRLEDNRVFCPRSLVRTPERRKFQQPTKRKPCLLLMHIPKTAGTAVRSALRSDALTDRQLWLYGEPPGLPLEHVHYLSESQLNRAECVVGHFYFGMHTSFPQATAYATIVREPVDRCVSYYHHERTKSSDPNEPARNLTLDEMVHGKLSAQYDNLAVRMIAGSVDLARDVTQDVYKQAIDNISRDFCYVGLQDKTADAVKSLANYLGLKPNALQIENVGAYEHRTALAPSTIRALRDLNRYDIELCNYIRSRFWSSGAEGWVARRR